MDENLIYFYRQLMLLLWFIRWFWKATLQKRQINKMNNKTIIIIIIVVVVSRSSSSKLIIILINNI